MICAVHALVGAAIGRLAGSRPQAVAGGIASHFLGDLLPHKDFPPHIEAPLLAGTLGFLVWRFGASSPEFLGAAGAVAPDVENAAWMAGLVARERVRFPSHIGDGLFHGRSVRSAAPQAAGALLCLLYLLGSKTR